MAKDVFQLSHFATLHLRSAKFCTLGGVSVLVFVLRLASSSSDNIGNLSCSLLLLTRSRERVKFGKFRHCQITMWLVCRVDAMLCVDWLISITCCFFVYLIG